MAYATGPVTDYNDFLTKLIEFASGTAASWSGWSSGGAVPSGQQWTVLANSIPSGGSGGLTTVGTAYLEGPGSVSGDNIIVGLQTYHNVSDFIFGVAIQGYTEYDDTLTWSTMLGVSPTCYCALAGVAFEAWFWVSGRRIMATARIASLYDFTIYLGFLLPYGTHNQYPYPLVVSGTSPDATQPYTRADYYASGIPTPGTGSNCCQFRWIDGTWQGVGQLNGSGGVQALTTFGMYPMIDLVPSDGAEVPQNSYTAAAFPYRVDEDLIFGAWSITGTQYTNNEINAYQIWPVVLHSNDQLVGQLENIFVVNGNGLNPGDTLTISGTTYDVFHNCWRSSANAYYCIPRT